MDIINFLGSELYINAIYSFSEKYNLKVCCFDEGSYDFYKRISDKELTVAQLSLKEIVDLLETEFDKILNFAYLNILKFSGEDDDGESEGYSCVGDMRGNSCQPGLHGRSAHLGAEGARSDAPSALFMVPQGRPGQDRDPSPEITDSKARVQLFPPLADQMRWRQN